MSERDLSRMGGAESSKSLGGIGGPLIANSHTSHSLNQHLNLSNSNINSSHSHSHSHNNNNHISGSIMSPLAAHLPNSKSVPALHHHTGSGNICKSVCVCLHPAPTPALTICRLSVHVLIDFSLALLSVHLAHSPCQFQVTQHAQLA